MPLRSAQWIATALVGLCLLAPAVSAQPAGLQADIDQILDDSLMANAWWGAMAVDIASGDVLFSRNASRSFMPASVTKLFTTAAALDRLGPDATYQTEVFIDGPVVDGRLLGNLIVRGSGDPTIGGETSKNRKAVFRAWADSLRAMGVTRILGDIIGDDDIFDDTPFGVIWSWDDETFGYAAAVSGLSFHDNVIDLTLKPRALGQPASVSWEPDRTSYVQIVNRTVTTASGSRLTEGYDRTRESNVITLTSEIPLGRSDTEQLTVHNPTQYFVHVLRETLLQEDIAVHGRAVDVDALSIRPNYAGSHLRRIATHVSAPLSQIIEIINKESQNLYAEQVLRTLAVRYPVSGKDLTPGSAEMGIQSAMATYHAAGIDTSRLQLVDGSGLSRKNLVTPEMVVSLLRFMDRHEDPAVRTAFLASLSVGGRDGTLAHRFRSGAAAGGRVRAKTGSLGNVNALCGFVDTAEGRRIAFALLSNHFTVKMRHITRVQDRIVSRLARQRMAR